MPDDYNWPATVRKKELAYHNSKVQEVPFYNVGRHPVKRANSLNCRYGTINSLKEIINPNDLDVGLKKAEKREVEARFAPTKFEHDRPFNPTGNKTHNKRCDDMIGKFPAFMPQGYGRVVTRKEPDPDAKPGFKLTHRGKTAPSPSIATNFRNLRTAGAVLRR